MNMRTILFSEQVRHENTTAKDKLNELFEMFESILNSKFINENDDINFTGNVLVQGKEILTNDYFENWKLVRYNDHLPTFTDKTALGIPTGNATLRPACGSAGYIRFNVDTSSFEGFDGKQWSRFRTINRVENPDYSEEFIVNSNSFWEYDTWCMFGENTDARNRQIQLSMMDTITGSPTSGMWIDPRGMATFAIKDRRFIRVYNRHITSLQFFIRIT